MHVVDEEISPIDYAVNICIYTIVIDQIPLIRGTVLKLNVTLTSS